MDGIFKPPLKATVTEPAFGVSIIIPCHGCADTLLETVQSIIKVKPRDIPIEIIMVDDDPQNSKTRAACARAVHEVMGNGIYVSLLTHDTNKGVSSARNTALAEAKYKYIWPIDSDDKLPANSRFIEKAVDILERDDDTALIYPYMRHFGADTKRHPTPYYHERHVPIRNSISCCSMYRRDEAIAVGGYNEGISFGEDQELGLAMLARRLEEAPQRPRRVRCLRDETYLYRQHADSSSLCGQHVKANPNGDMVSHLTMLAGRASALFQHNYGTSDPAAILRRFNRSIEGIWVNGAGRIASVLQGRRPPSDLLRWPNAFKRRPVI